MERLADNLSFWQKAAKKVAGNISLHNDWLFRKFSKAANPATAQNIIAFATWQATTILQDSLEINNYTLASGFALQENRKLSTILYRAGNHIAQSPLFPNTPEGRLAALYDLTIQAIHYTSEISPAKSKELHDTFFTLMKDINALGLKLDITSGIISKQLDIIKSSGNDAVQEGNAYVVAKGNRNYAGYRIILPPP